MLLISWQQIADWLNSIDDSKAKNDWKWKAQYALPEMVKDMLENLPNSIKNHK